MLRAVVGIVLAIALIGCSLGRTSLALPEVEGLGRGVALEDLAALDRLATAVAVVRPTGRPRIDEAGPGGTPFPIVELRVLDVIKGELPDVIELRQGYTYLDDQGASIPIVSGPGQFLLYLEPFDSGVSEPWNGEWVTSAWLSGVYMDLGIDSGVFTRVDRERESLPGELTAEEARRVAPSP